MKIQNKSLNMVYSKFFCYCYFYDDASLKVSHRPFWKTKWTIKSKCSQGTFYWWQPYCCQIWEPEIIMHKAIEYVLCLNKFFRHLIQNIWNKHHIYKLSSNRRRYTEQKNFVGKSVLHLGRQLHAQS